MKVSWISAAQWIACFVFFAALSQAAALTTAEVQKLESDLGVVLSSNEVVQLDAIVNPSNRPPWRIDAEARIRSHRMADLNLRVVDQNGDPVEGAAVSVHMRSSAFRFGGIMNLKDFNDVDGNLQVPVQTYRNLFRKLFNSAGLDNGLKPKLRAGNEALLPSFFSWAQTNGLPVRGHLLIWPGNLNKNHLPGELPDTPTSYSVLSKVEALEASLTNGSSQAVIDSLKADLKGEVDFMIADWSSKWPVYEWDVINETLSNYRIQDLLGYDQMAEWFKIAQSNAVNPDCRFLINEFQVISAKSAALNASHYPTRKAAYMANIDQVLAGGGPLSRIGFQSRFKFEQPDPSVIYSRLEDFSGVYGLEMAGTEFEIPDSAASGGIDFSEELRARMTEEILTTYFSHPLVTGLNAWTYMKGETRSLCYYDGTVKLNGLVWYYLHRMRYSTDATLSSSLDGRTALRAFKGDYDITVSYKGQDYLSSLSVSNNESIVLQLGSSLADAQAVAEVVDAWHYDGLTNGAGLAQGVSTGTVGGIAFADNALASIQDGRVRWQSDGVSDSMYQGRDVSSYDGASNGAFQLSADFLDADFSASAAVSNGSGRVNFGMRYLGTASTNDAYFCLAFLSGGGTNPVYQLEVKDAANNNTVVGTFAGTTLGHLAVRAVYDLDHDTLDVYYRHDGGAEQLAHSGALVSGFALDQLRSVAQTYNGGVNWMAGDQVFTDNLILRRLGTPPPPPASVKLEEWDYAGVTNGAGINAGLSTTGTGSAWSDKAPFGVVSNQMQRWRATGAANESGFFDLSDGSYADATSGVYQLSYDVVSADFSNTDAFGGKAQFGYGVRDATLSGGARNGVLLVRYEDTGGQNEFRLSLSAGTTVQQTIAAGHSISNLHVRAVYNLDNAGATGSFMGYFSINGGTETAVTNALASGFTLRTLRMHIQALNGGNSWQPGDMVLIDNITFLKQMPVTPSSLLAAWLADYPTLGSATNLVDNPDGDAANNLAEYAFGGDPTNALDAGALPGYRTVSAGGTNYVEYVYAKRNDAAARGLDYAVQTTPDLVSGAWTNAGYVVVGSAPIDGAFDSVTNRMPTNAAQRFIRLKVGFTP